LSQLTSSIKLNIQNSIGWKTRRKIAIIESDDWGSIRMASKEAYNYLLKKGYKVDECSYNRNDALECNEDMEMLFGALSSVKDMHGSHAKITANTIVANPDFNKIRDSDYQQYYYEPFTETLKRYPNHDKVLEFYKEGIAANIFIPQFHGREHLNVLNWMNALGAAKKEVKDAFEFEMFTIHAHGLSSCRKEYLQAFGGYSTQEIEGYKSKLITGIDLFRNLMGYESPSFIAPCYTWPTEIEETLKSCGIHYIQGTRVQRVPSKTSKGFKKQYHYLGQRNKHGQFYLVRNAFFEPSSDPHKDWINSCMGEIDNAFFWNKPAIISSHRVNYIGGINSSNRSTGVKLLRQLLSNLIKKHPSVEFMTSDQLGDLISQSA